MLPGPWVLLLFALLNCSENLFCGQFDLRLFWLVPGKTGSHVETSMTSSEENIDANHSFSFLAIGPSFPEYPIYTLIIFQAIDFLTGFLFLRYLRTFLLVTSVPLGGHFFFFIIWFASLEFYIQQDKFAFFYFPHLHRICAFRWMAILLLIASFVLLFKYTGFFQILFNALFCFCMCACVQFFVVLF